MVIIQFKKGILLKVEYYYLHEILIMEEKCNSKVGVIHYISDVYLFSVLKVLVS